MATLAAPASIAEILFLGQKASAQDRPSIPDGHPARPLIAAAVRRWFGVDVQDAPMVGLIKYAGPGNGIIIEVGPATMHLEDSGIEGWVSINAQPARDPAAEMRRTLAALHTIPEDLVLVTLSTGQDAEGLTGKLEWHIVRV